MKQPLAAAIVAALRLYSPGDLARAASVEAGSFMNVTVDAPLYDRSTTIGGGCDPAGCVGDLTRDGDMTSTSRWSCSPSLGDIGSTCAITYSLTNSSTLEALQVAMYKGDLRIVNVDVFVDEAKHRSWASSGTTTDFERIELGATGQTVELRGVLDESEWLSITEVEIMVLLDDGTTAAPNATPTTAPTTMVTATAPSPTVAPAAARDTAVSAPTPVEPPPTPTDATVEPTTAGTDFKTANGVPARFSGGTLAATLVGATFGLMSLLLIV